MPIPADYTAIVSALSQKTSEGALTWQKNPYNVSAHVDDSKFSLWGGNDESSDKPFVAFTLGNAEGVVDSWYVDESDADYKEVLDLYKSANRQALGAPVRLKELADRIASLKKI